MHDKDLKNSGILIVDDDRNLREMLETLLIKEGFKNIFTASDGIECLSVLQQQGENILLILLDLRMPKMDGFQVIEHLINIHKPIVGIVVITGFGSISSSKEFYAKGTDNIIPFNYLVKPFDLDLLYIEVRKTISHIILKRQSQMNLSINRIYERFGVIENEQKNIKQVIDNLNSKIPNILGQLGMDVIRSILIGLFVILFIYFGFGDFLLKFIKYIK